jgi:hypothetical protein
MALYSRFRASGHVDTLERKCANDLDALGVARDLCTDHTVEVYDKKRFVAQVNKADGAVNVDDGAPSDNALSENSLRRFSEDAKNRVDVAVAATQQRVNLSYLSMAQDREAYSSSMKAVRRSKDALTRVSANSSVPLKS